MTDWIEHNGGPRPVGEDVLVSMRLRGGRVRSPRIKWEHCGGPGDVVAYRILNQHLIDAARKEGIRLGLEAAAEKSAEWQIRPSTRFVDDVIRALNPETIAKRRNMTDPIDLTPEELLRFQEIMKAWHKVWDEGTTDKPLFDIPQEAQHD